MKPTGSSLQMSAPPQALSCSGRSEDQGQGLAVALTPSSLQADAGLFPVGFSPEWTEDRTSFIIVAAAAELPQLHLLWSNRDCPQPEPVSSSSGACIQKLSTSSQVTPSGRGAQLGSLFYFLS